MSSVNKVIIVGNLGNDPEIRTFQNGGKVCNLSIATSKSWKDKATGERKEKTEWHRVVIKNTALVTICEQYLGKGAKVYIEGELETRKYTDKDGVEKYTTEVSVPPFSGVLTMLDSRNTNTSAPEARNSPQQTAAAGSFNDMDDEIPF